MRTTILVETTGMYMAHSLDKFCSNGTKGFLVVGRVLEMNYGPITGMLIEFPCYGKEWTEENNIIKKVKLSLPIYKAPEERDRPKTLTLSIDSRCTLYCEGIKPKFRYDHRIKQKELLLKNGELICTPKRPLIKEVWPEMNTPPSHPERTAIDIYLAERNQCTVSE